MKDKENTGDHADGIQNYRHADAHGVLRFENDFFRAGVFLLSHWRCTPNFSNRWRINLRIRRRDQCPNGRNLVLWDHMGQPVINQDRDIIVALHAISGQHHAQDDGRIGNALILVKNKVAQAVSDQTAVIVFDLLAAHAGANRSPGPRRRQWRHGLPSAVRWRDLG